MSWDGIKRRQTDNGQRDHDLLNTINIRVGILLDNFDKHMVDDKIAFEKLDKRIGTLEKVYWVGIACLVVTEFIFKFIK